MTKFKVNLLPPEVLKLRRKNRLFSAMRIGLAVVWIIAIVFTGWLYYQYRSEKRIVVEKEGLVSALRRQLRKENLVELFKEAEAFIRRVKGFTSGLLPAYEFFIYLSSNLPEGVRIEKVESGKDGRNLKITGAASSPEALAALIDVLKKSEVVQKLSIPKLEGEKDGITPFDFTCRLKGWW